MCDPGCPETHSVDQAGLELTEPVSASLVHTSPPPSLNDFFESSDFPPSPYLRPASQYMHGFNIYP